MTGRSQRSVEDAQNELGATGTAITADVTKSRLNLLPVSAGARKYGRIDVLYVNAGIAELVAPSRETTSTSSFHEILDANFGCGAYFTVQKALPLLSDGGAIVFTTSWFDEAGVAGRQPCRPRRRGCAT